MSFSWITNSWGGPANYGDWSPAAAALTRGPSLVHVANNFPAAPLSSSTLPQAKAGTFDYQIPDYLPLRDMSADKSPLAIQRGGYSGLPPTIDNAAKCQMDTLSSRYYCPLLQNARGPVLLGTYGPQ